MCIGDAAFKLWTLGDLSRVEQSLTQDMAHPSDPIHHAHALAQRALVRARSGQWDMANDDAEQVFIGHGLYTLCQRLHASPSKFSDLLLVISQTRLPTFSMESKSQPYAYMT